MSHPLVRPETVEDRGYQQALADRVAEAPHLLVLPTGLGKTVIALRAILAFLEREPARRILVLAPTKPLADQHARFFRETLLGVPVACFTGESPPTERDAEWGRHRLIVATPQVVQNDVVRGARALDDVSFVVYDEAHRATGNYPYPFLARRYREAGGRHALGLTASPGNTSAAVQRVLSNLGLERVEVRTEADPDVSSYVHKVDMEWVRVRPSPTQLRLVKLLERCYARCVLALRRLGYFQLLRGLPGRKDLLDLGHRLRAEASSGRGGRAVYEGVSLQARALKIQHALELVETQGSASLHRFLQRIEQEAGNSGGSKAARDFLREPEFVEALALAQADRDVPPKIAKIVDLVRGELGRGARRVLVFANYRETAESLVEHVGRLDGIRANRFVGHSVSQGEKGMTKREQQAIVDRFRAGDLNVLVATAVGEEGLDLPETDAVFFHEAVPSAIRMIQRRGRTGRRTDGRVFVLLTEGTRDESYHWSAMRRERRMRAELAVLRRLAPTIPLDAAPPISAPPPPRPARAAEGLEVTMDPREAASPVARALVDRGLTVKSVALAAGDYGVGPRILVERKSAADLAASLRDGRLFDQLPRLARAACPVLLVEGDPFAAATGLAPAALAGALAAAVVDHRVSVVCVPDAAGTADFLVSLARREQRDGRTGALRFGKGPPNPESQLRFVVEGLPGVGPVLARRLLERFGSLAALAAATVEDLASVDGIGDATARGLHEVLHRPFVGAPARGLGPPVLALEARDGPARPQGFDAERGPETGERDGGLEALP